MSPEFPEILAAGFPLQPTTFCGGGAGAEREENHHALHEALSENGSPTLETVMKGREAPGPQRRIEEVGAAKAAR